MKWNYREDFLYLVDKENKYKLLQQLGIRIISNSHMYTDV